MLLKAAVGAVPPPSLPPRASHGMMGSRLFMCFFLIVILTSARQSMSDTHHITESSCLFCVRGGFSVRSASQLLLIPDACGCHGNIVIMSYFFHFVAVAFMLLHFVPTSPFFLLLPPHSGLVLE